MDTTTRDQSRQAQPPRQGRPLWQVVAQNTARLRRERGWTVAELASRCVPPIASSTASFLEGGVRSFGTGSCGRPPGMLTRVPPAFGLEPWMLLVPYNREPCWNCKDAPGPLMICGICSKRGPSPVADLATGDGQPGAVVLDTSIA
jgi:hypothetical protein